MFITPYFGGCKYTNNFLFINKNIVFQHFVLLITFHSTPAGFPVRPGRTDFDHGIATDRVSSRYRERVYHCHLDRVPLCHLDRAERVERSPLPAFLPEKHNAIPPEAQRQTVRQFFERFAAGRCRKQWQNAQKRDRPSYFSPF